MQIQLKNLDKVLTVEINDADKFIGIIFAGNTMFMKLSDDNVKELIKFLQKNVE